MKQITKKKWTKKLTFWLFCIFLNLSWKYYRNFREKIIYTCANRQEIIFKVKSTIFWISINVISSRVALCFPFFLFVWSINTLYKIFSMRWKWIIFSLNAKANQIAMRANFLIIINNDEWYCKNIIVIYFSIFIMSVEFIKYEIISMDNF